MTGVSRELLKEILEGISQAYPRGAVTVSEAVVDLYADALRGISADALREAVRAHLRHPHRGQYFPKPADLIAALGLEAPEPSEVVALAKLARCPFGVMARGHIGTWDLKYQNAHHLAQRAQEVIALWPEWIKRASRGLYTPHELERMRAHGVDPRAPFAPHCLPAQPAARARIEQTLAALPPPSAEDQPAPASPGKSLLEAVFGGESEPSHTEPAP